MKKIILLALAAMMMVGCDIAMDSLDVVNGTMYIVTSKRKREHYYSYHLVKVGDTWYDYHYKDTANAISRDLKIVGEY